MEAQAEWNLIFLIYADLRDESNQSASEILEFDQFERQLRSLTIPENCNYFFIKNVITVGKDLEVQDDTFTFDQMISRSSVQRSPAVLSQQMTQKETILADIFSTIHTNYRAKKTILFTWDHGSIFGINRVASLKIINGWTENFLGNHFLKSSLSRGFYVNPMIKAINDNFRGERFFKGLTDSILNPSNWLGYFINYDRRKETDENYVVDMLTNEMLGRALKAGYGEQKIDILCMMNCCMHNLATQYAVRESVRYLIAPQTWIHHFPGGYDYEAIFTHVSQNPSIGPRDLGRFIIDRYKENAASKADDDNMHFEIIYQTDLEETASVAALIKKLVEYETVLIGDQRTRNNIRTLFGQKMLEYDDLNMPDYRLLDLKTFFVRRTDGASPPDHYPDVQQKIANLILRIVERNKISAFMGKYTDGYNSSGLSMSMPSEKVYINPAQFFIRTFFDSTSPYCADLIKCTALDRYFKKLYA